MLDVYFGNMDGVEVHAETPEEEQEAAFILNSALSGKTTFAGGCLCPSKADSTVSKGFRLMLSEGTDLYVTPALDVDGTPALEICCTTANEEQQEADEPAYTMELGIEPAKEHYTLRDYIAVMYQFIWNLTDNELMLMGHNKKEGKNRLGLGIEMIDMLADYSEEATWDSYCDFVGRNFSGIWFCPHEELDLEEMDDKDKLEWVYESDDMEDEWPF
mgnify:FL=1